MKLDTYKHIDSITRSVINNKSKPVSNLANFCSILNSELNHLWIGFYLVDQANNELYLGPFQGPLACTKIQFGKGVCGTAWEQKKTIIVNNVHEYPGHIACSSLSNSEIVIPIICDGEVVAVLDIDSIELGKFDKIDQTCLEKLCDYLRITCF